MVSWERHLGWLLLVWRLEHGPVPAAEVERLRAYDTLPSYDECIGVERACGLPVGMLSSIPELDWLSAGRPGPDPAPGQTDATELVERALADRITVGEWAALGRAIRSGATVPSRCWTGLVARLLDALPRGVGHVYRLHRVAALSLLTRAEHREEFVTAIRHGVLDVDGPAFLEPIGLLDLITTKSSNSLILDLLADPRNRAERSYAAWLATQVWLRGGFDDIDRARVVMTVLTAWRADPIQAREDFGQLIDVLPDGVRGVLTRAHDLEERGRREELDPPTVADIGPGVTDLLVERVVVGRDADLLLPNLRVLLWTALFERSSEQRYRSAQMLGASPLRGPVGSAVLELLGRDGLPAPIRRRAVRVLNNVVLEEHRLRMTPLIRDPDVLVAAPAITALGHIPASAISDQEVRKRLPDEQLPLGRGCLYMLGMTGSDALAPLAASTSVPRWQSRTAAWWLRAGPAIMDS